MHTKLEGLSIIGYGRRDRSERASAALNPATGAELEPRYYAATQQHVETATHLAAKAFEQYRSWAPKQRADLLRRIADLFEGNAAAIIERANQETALSVARLQGETARTCGQLRLFATLLEAGWWQDARIDHADPARKPVPKPDVRSMLIPLGPVAVFSSSNFPLAFSVAGGDTASALAAGCPVIVKPHQGHPGTSELVGLVITQAARECGAPEGIFSMLYGSGREVGIALVRHPLVKAVGFTGSRAGGRALMDAAAARPEPIPVYAEMGSINPVFFLPRALEASPETLAAGLHASVTLGVGQFCTNPGLVFIEAGPSSEKFLEKLETLMAGTPAGTMLTPSICSEYQAGLEKFSRVPGVQRGRASVLASPDSAALCQPSPPI
jgi:2,5-dioxopentanoate dehydrogenase